MREWRPERVDPRGLASNVFGGVLGVAGGSAFNRLMVGEGAAFSWEWFGYSFAICAGIGAVAGLYPATRAAGKDVIDALRYE